MFLPVKIHSIGQRIVSSQLDDLICAITTKEISLSVTLADAGLTSQDVEKISMVLDRGPPVTMLVLSSNRIDDAGAIRLAKSLKGNASLKLLDLANNCIGNQGIKALTEAIQEHSVLETLVVQDNPFGQIGFDALRRIDQVGKVKIVCRADLKKSNWIDIANNSHGKHSAAR